MTAKRTPAKRTASKRATPKSTARRVRPADVDATPGQLATDAGGRPRTDAGGRPVIAGGAA